MKITLTCRKVVARMGRFVDRDLRRSQRALVLIHLLGCRDCRRYLRSYVATIRAARKPSAGAGPAAQPPRAPEEFVRSVLAAWRRS